MRLPLLAKPRMGGVFTRFFFNDSKHCFAWTQYSPDLKIYEACSFNSK